MLRLRCSQSVLVFSYSSPWPITAYTTLWPLTIELRSQEVVLYPGSLTWMEFPEQPVARTQWAPLWTLQMTTWLALRLAQIWLLATFPLQLSPIEETAPQTMRSPETQPPCAFSHELRVPGLQFLPAPASPIATDDMAHPALQIVLEDVPSWLLPHLESHCLKVGQVLERAITTRSVHRIVFNIVDQ